MLPTQLIMIAILCEIFIILYEFVKDYYDNIM